MHALQGYSSRPGLSVCYHESCFIPRLYVERKVSQGVLVVWFTLKTICSTVLTSFADHSYLPCSLKSSRWTKETTMAFFSVQRVCTVSDSSYVTTDLPLITAQSLHAGVKFLWLCHLWPCKCARIGMATVSLWQLLHYNILKGWSALWGKK